MGTTELIYKVSTKVLGDDIFDYFKDDYETRLLIQKTMYVFQESTKKDLFHYSWYFAGPYSSYVANIAYHSILPNLDTKKSLWNDISFSNIGNNKTEQVINYLCYDNSRITNLSKVEFYELMASMLYLYYYNRAFDETKKRLYRAKKNRFDEQIIYFVVDNFWDRLEQFVA
jgi:hypothetical protein